MVMNVSGRNKDYAKGQRKRHNDFYNRQACEPMNHKSANVDPAVGKGVMLTTFVADLNPLPIARVNGTNGLISAQVFRYVATA
jgi:hypothetical protein